MSHAQLRLRHQVREGLHRLSLLLRDSGQPPQQREQPLNVTVCRCGKDGACLPGATARRAGGAGISLGALVIVLASVILLLRECLRADTCWALASPLAAPPHPQPRVQPQLNGQAPTSSCPPPPPLSAGPASGPRCKVPAAVWRQGISAWAAG